MDSSRISKSNTKKIAANTAQEDCLKEFDEFFQAINTNDSQSTMKIGKKLETHQTTSFVDRDIEHSEVSYLI